MISKIRFHGWHLNWFVVDSWVLSWETTWCWWYFSSKWAWLEVHQSWKLVIITESKTSQCLKCKFMMTNLCNLLVQYTKEMWWEDGTANDEDVVTTLLLYYIYLKHCCSMLPGVSKILLVLFKGLISAVLRDIGLKC